MDQYSEILASLPGLRARLDKAGVDRWLKEQRQVTVEGQTYFVLGGDRLASEAEAMVWFALDQHLVAPDEVRSAASGQPLPPGVEAVHIDTPEGEE